MKENYQPSLAGLRAFVAVAEFQHFGLAAEKLGVTQPTLSQALATLESGLDVKLIERSTRRVELTEIGKHLLKKTQNILNSIDNLSNYVEKTNFKVNSTLKLGVIPTIAPYILPSILSGIKSESDKSDIAIKKIEVVEDKTSDLLSEIHKGNLDIAMVVLGIADTNIYQIPLYKEQFEVISYPEHKFYTKTQINIEDLSNQELILLAEGHCFREQVIDLCRLNSADPSYLNSKAASISTAIQFVAGGLGITFIPASAKHVELRNNNVKSTKISPQPPTRTIGLVFRKTSNRKQQFEQFSIQIKNILRNKDLLELSIF